MANIDPTTPAGVQPAGFSSGWTLTFSDEFNANSLDPKWQVGSWYSTSYTGGNFDTNNGGNSCFRMWPPADVAVGNYNSHGYFASPDNTIHTQNAFTQNGGFFEANMKLSVGVQCWPAFWVDNGGQNEIDFMEAYGQNGGGWGFIGGDGFIHSNNYAATSHPTAPVTTFGSFKYADPPPNGTGRTIDLSAGFHKYGFRWDAASGNGQSYFDGVPWGPYTAVGLPGGAQCWVIITLAFATFTGSASGGDPPRGSGNSLQVDWCRVWQPGGTGPVFNASLTSAPADGSTISGVVPFVIDGALIQNAELLPATGYTPKYGTFTISGGGTHGVFNWDTTVSNPSLIQAQTSAQQLIDDMTLSHQAVLHGIPVTYDWGAHPRIGCDVNFPADYASPSVVPWGIIATDNAGDPSTNTRVQIRNMTLDVKRNNVWTRIDSTNTIVGALYTDFATNATAPANTRTESNGGISVKMPAGGGSFHFYVNTRYPVAFGAQEIVSRLETHLILDNAAGTDDRGSAKVLSMTGMDVWRNGSIGWNGTLNNVDIAIGRAKYIGTALMDGSAHTLSPLSQATDYLAFAQPLPPSPIVNGPITVRISAYNVPAGSTGGTEIVVVTRNYIINNNTGNLWVSPTGSDSNNGTSPGTPFLTIAKAASVATPNTVVNVAAGTYTGSFMTSSSGNNGQPITYISTTKWGAKIVPPGSGTNIGWDQRGAWTIIDGFEIDGQGGSNTVWTKGIRLGGSNSIVRNCKVHDVATNAALCVAAGGCGVHADSFYGGLSQSVTENIVYNVGSLNCQYVHGIIVSTTGDVKNNLIYTIGGAGIYTFNDAKNDNVINNTIFNCRWGINVSSGSPWLGTTSNDNSNFHNNIVYDCTEAGFSNNGPIGPNNQYNNNCVNTTVLSFQTPATSNALSATVTTNPTFVNYIQAGGGDYHLSAGSGCISGGTLTLAPTIDLELSPRTGLPDIGCYKFSGVIPPPPPPPAQFTQEFFGMDICTPWKKK